MYRDVEYLAPLTAGEAEILAGKILTYVSRSGARLRYRPVVKDGHRFEMAAYSTLPGPVFVRDYICTTCQSHGHALAVTRIGGDEVPALVAASEAGLGWD